MCTEAQSTNTVEVAVMDGGFNDLVRGKVNLNLAPNGGWFTLTLTNPLSFKAGETFCLELGASHAIQYPAGADNDAQVPNRSYHYNWTTNQYEAIGAVTGFENGAYLIRAVGTKSGGNTNQPPVAKAQLSKQQAGVGESITFDASQSFDPDGQITQYLWDFGDNNSSNQKIATHAYAQAGNYLIKLTVTDDRGATGQKVGLLTISPAGTNRLVVDPASGTIAPGGTQSIKVTFDAQGLAEGDYQGQISIVSNGGNRTLPVHIHVSSVSTSTVELIYDSGVSTIEYHWLGAGEGSAVRFTPPGLPAKVKEAKIFIGSIQNGNKHKLRVLADANGRPGNTILGPIEFSLSTTGWVRYDLSAANLTVNGDFYVMIEYDGTNRPSFGAESTAPLEKRSWDFEGGEWTLYEAEDYLIRAVVEYTTTGVDDRADNNHLPNTIVLEQNYPNPFNPETSIRYELPQDGNVTLTVFDLNGRRVALLESGPKKAGQHHVHWDGHDGAGNRVTSGVYFYRLEATSQAGTATVLTRKMIVMK
jgi:PKD repeat protein